MTRKTIALLGPFFEVPRGDMPAHKAPRLTDEVLALATAKFVVPCNDVYLVDEQGSIVLAKRKNAAARGWWVMGGSAIPGITAEEAVATILTREIGFAPEAEPLALYEHHWADSRERPGEYRQDRILAWVAKVDEAAIARIKLDPNEYDVGAGLMRFDGSQEGLRPVLYEMLNIIREHLAAT